jgi:Dyp-type peroxidase family
MANPIDVMRKPAAFAGLQRQKSDAAPAPDEPLVDVREVQGNIIPGFNKPVQTFTAYRIGRVKGAKIWLKAVEPLVSTAEEVLAFRKLYRERRARLGGARPAHLVDTNTSVAVSFTALRKLAGPSADLFTDAGFRAGLAARSALLGEPTDPKHEGSPGRWKVGGPRNAAAVLVISGSDSEAMLDERTRAIDALAAANGLEVVYREKGRIRADLPGHEQFGFDDGVSQPGVRGRISVSPDELLTPRVIDRSAGAEASLYALPGQDLAWPGEFLFGYPTNGPDPLIPGPVRDGAPEWARNGSLVAFNRFRQDVAMFWRFMLDHAKALASQPGFAGLDATRLAALLVGRWPSGAPVSRTPQTDIPELGQDQYANNHFFFGVDTQLAPLIPIPGYDGDHYPQASADPLGFACPVASHIRKVNTRDMANDQGGHGTTYTARILRRGLPFGPPLGDPFAKKDPAKGNRGLLFVSYQTSIVDQYELLRGVWMGDAKPPRMPGGDDMIVGMNGRPGQGRERRCIIFGSGGQAGSVSTGPQGGEWIVPTGGGYFFAPSISALRMLSA